MYCAAGRLPRPDWRNPKPVPRSTPSERRKAVKAPEVKRMNMNVPKDLHDSFKAAAAARGEIMTDILLAYIEQYVKKNGVQPKKGRR
jgi:hypothetical protein